MVCVLKFLLLSAALVSDPCVEILRGYMANANRVNWQLVAQFVAADAIVQLQRRRRRKPIRRLLRDRRQLGEYFTLVRDMRNGDGTDFFQYFRMSVERFDRLVELLRPLIEPRRSTVVSLSAGEKLAFTLRYLAHGSTMRIIAKSYRISDSMAGRIVRQTCLALRQVLEPLYLPHPTAADWRRIAAEFEREWNFPNCIGAIDGKHIDIEAPAWFNGLFQRRSDGPGSGQPATFGALAWLQSSYRICRRSDGPGSGQPATFGALAWLQSSYRICVCSVRCI
ncbi:uncharacterized protein LOC144102781 [Amblyomma americanum]